MKAPNWLANSIVAFALCCVAHAQVATSANYAITASSIDAGGQLITSGHYTMNIVIGPISGRSVATRSDANILGFAAQLNNAPEPADDIRSHPQDLAVDIPKAALLSNDTDPDGDPLSFLSVDATSARGGAVTINGAIIHYAPPAGFSGSDAFSYAIVDANGDIGEATVTMLVAPPSGEQPLNTVALIKQSDGKILVRFRQQQGFRDYIIESTHDLNSRQWETLYVAHAGADGVVEILIDPTEAEQTFYRALVF